MNYVHLPSDILKGDNDIQLAEAFIKSRSIKPQPRWYANLLETHSEDIMNVFLLWLEVVEEKLKGISIEYWVNPMLWYEIEELLNAALSTKMYYAAMQAVRMQAIAGDLPVSITTAEIESAVWANREAITQASLIAKETRNSIAYAVERCKQAGLTDEDIEKVILETGLYRLNQRYAGATLNQFLGEEKIGVPLDTRIQQVLGYSESLSSVREQMVVQSNTVDAIHAGMAITAMLWERDEGKTVYKTWFTHLDERRCPVCGSMHMQTKRRDVPFTAYDGSTYQRPKAHPFCRCFVEYVTRKGEEYSIELAG
jgi:hypothetical protein